MKTHKKLKEEAGGVPVEATDQSDRPVLEGFGIITLASILPILAVEILAIAVSGIYSVEDIMKMPAKVSIASEPQDQTPAVELINAMRSILPLNATLILLVTVLLRRELPVLSIFETASGENSDPAKIKDEGQSTAAQSRAAFGNLKAQDKFRSFIRRPSVALLLAPAILEGKYGPLIFGVTEGLAGMYMFNLGLTWASIFAFNTELQAARPNALCSCSGCFI